MRTSFDELLKCTSLDFGVPMPSEAKSKIIRKLDVLKEKLPMNSSIDLNFYHQGNGLKGHLKIRTLSSEFSSSHSDYSVLSIYEHLETEIKKQVLNWKKNRFKPNKLLNPGGLSHYPCHMGGT